MPLVRALLVRLARLAVLPLHARVRRFLESCSNPEKVQSKLLFDLLKRQAATAFGRDHGFGSIRTVDDYRRLVPIAPYERLAPYIERVKSGETSALFAEDTLRFFALTSGTTAARKFIPVTDRYLRDYRRSWAMWGVRAYRDHRPRDLALRPIVQLGGDPCEFVTETGVPCGNLSGYTASQQRRIARRQYVVPPECGRMSDPTARSYTAMRFALGKPVALFTAANPSTLLAMARILNEHREKLIRDLHDGTLNRELDVPGELRRTLEAKLAPNPSEARRLGAIAERLGRLCPKDIWPEETILIGSWTGGSMGPYLRQLPVYFGEAPVRDLGLIASEGRFTIPFANGTPSGVLDIASHYFEFVPEAEIDSVNPTVLGAGELELGGSYFLIPTTQAGLYRYHISDLVRVAGFVGRTPLVEFLGKGNRFASITGEKLSEHHVTQAMEALASHPAFRLSAYALAPVWHDVAPYYVLLVEAREATEALRQLLPEFDAALRRQNIEYDAKRTSGRLGPVAIQVLPDGAWAAWDRGRMARSGGSPEQYKRPCLQGDLGFIESMSTPIPAT